MQLEIYKIKVSENFRAATNIRDLSYFAVKSDLRATCYIMFSNGTIETFSYYFVLNSEVVAVELISAVCDEVLPPSKPLASSMLDLVGGKPKITIEF